VEQLFSKATGRNLKPLFDFYLRTTNRLEFNVKELGYQQYQITQSNYFMDLALDIQIDNKVERVLLTKEGIKIKSKTPPIVDPGGYYLKKVVIE
jgi:hypothetical protein